MSLNNFATIVALGLSLCAVVYSAGIQAAAINDQRRRIDALEAKNDRMFEAIARIDSRTASIEATLRILVPDKGPQ